MEKSLWRRGKDETKKFESIKLKGFKSTGAFLLSILFTIVIILPLAIILFQLIALYGYHRIIMRFLLFFSWVGLMLANGLSNYFTLELSKHYYPDNPQLQSLDSKAVFFYQTFNIGFAIWMIVMIILLVILLSRA